MITVAQHDLQFCAGHFHTTSDELFQHTVSWHKRWHPPRKTKQRKPNSFGFNYAHSFSQNGEQRLSGSYFQSSNTKHISSQRDEVHRTRKKVQFINANHQACNNITFFGSSWNFQNTHIYRITFVFHLSRGLRTQTHKPSVEFHLVPAAESLTLSLEGEFSGSNADASQCTNSTCRLSFTFRDFTSFLLTLLRPLWKEISIHWDLEGQLNLMVTYCLFRQSWWHKAGSHGPPCSDIAWGVQTPANSLAYSVGDRYLRPTRGSPPLISLLAALPAFSLARKTITIRKKQTIPSRGLVLLISAITLSGRLIC